MAYITLTKDYGYSQYMVSNLEAYSVIDASDATWIVSNSRNQFPDADTSYLEGSGELNKYPFRVKGAGEGLLIKGGAIWGEVPQLSNWDYTYNNSAAIQVDYAPGVIIDDWRIDKAWDAIRLYTGSKNFLIDDAHLSNIRDDAVENDQAYSGTIRDSLFDGVTSGISLTEDSQMNGSMNTVRLEGVFMRMKIFDFRGDMTHASPFKTDVSSPGNTPDIRIFNSVIAIEDVNHAEQKRLKVAWDNVVESSGNVFLNLSDTPLPSTYPQPPAGFTILQGQAARDYWEASKNAWLANHDGVNDAGITALPPLPGSSTSPTSPVPESTSPTAPAPSPEPTSYNVINGGGNGNGLTGTSGSDQINGYGGNDRINGKGGADILIGGTGRDTFVFDSRLDGTVDKITDFNVADDAIYLDNAIFTKFGSGSWSSPWRVSVNNFKAGDGVKATDSNDYLLYDTRSGVLSYDADGSGSGAPVAIAELSPGLGLNQYDLFIV